MISRSTLTKVRIRENSDGEPDTLPYSPLNKTPSFIFWLTHLVLFILGIDATDYTKLWNDMRQEISLVTGPKSALPGQGSFGHITGGYDAGAFFHVANLVFNRFRKLTVKLPSGKKGYYGYMYSLVFAADMYATVFKKDPLNPALGEKYKDCILLPGGSREELDSLTVRCGAIHLGVCHMIGANRVNLQCAGVPRSPTERGSFHEGVVR